LLTTRTSDVSDLADLHADLGLSGVRWLGPGDAPRLVELIRACYGETYAHAPLYRPGAIEAAWTSGLLLSLGHLDEHGRLDAHTGFWRKDPRGDHVESGLSLVHPSARRGFALDSTTMWRSLLDRWSRIVGFIHQNTTTRHVHAQLYARRLMRAVPTGWVFEYALDEVLVGLAEAPAPMHALSMTTVLRPPALGLALAIPEGPWAGWLTDVIAGVLPDARVIEIEVGDSRDGDRPALELIEHNPSLGLRRRVITIDGASSSEPFESSVRVDLIHLPMTPAMVSSHWNALVTRGYLPVGVRPHRSRPSEIVLQAIADPAGCATAIAAMNLAGARLERLATGWLGACARTS
jgi:hypothetical protein